MENSGELRETSAGLRASDAEREAVVARLGTAVGEGRLTLEEFSDRVSAVYAARTTGELEPFTRDLPATPAATVVPRQQRHQTMIGAIKRRGRWRVDADTTLDVTVGPVKLDFRGAEFVGREVTVHVRTVVGAIKIWVPRGIRVLVDGDTVVGTRTVDESNLPPHVDVPTLHLRLDTVVGTVKVYRV
jgi:hypothetical protein